MNEKMAKRWRKFIRTNFDIPWFSGYVHEPVATRDMRHRASRARLDPRSGKAVYRAVKSAAKDLDRLGSGL